MFLFGKDVRMRSLGICLGASTVTVVELRKSERISIDNVYVIAHEGNPRKVLSSILSNISASLFDVIAVTGRKFRQLINLTTITEPEAVEKALAYVNHSQKKYHMVISAGGETFMVYVLDGSNRISRVLTGNKCAAGTGEFFLQQIRRMDITLDDAIKYSRTEKPYRVSGRCSVFCKSDCTHATNKGIPKPRVVAGLCEMMGDKILELVKRANSDGPVMLVGGTAQNAVMVDYLKKHISDLSIPEEAPYFEALGAALWALEKKKTKPFHGDLEKLFRRGRSSFEYLPPLNVAADLVTHKQTTYGSVMENDRCILGLDVGSTTTKAVLLRLSDDAILAKTYLRTQGDPIRASRNCYRELLKQISVPVEIVGLGVTGSGRQIAGLHAMTEGIINEIIAHAAAAMHFDPEVDTIFEIGGQDAKYTYITNGVPSDYAMNEACSAGTGSFLEESARETMGIEMEEIAEIALQAERPPNFNDQCAAFISSDIKNAFQEGIDKNDIVAGLVYSICMNYNNRVRGNRPMGEKVFMQGGVCYNRAVPVAMAALTGKKIVVPPEPGLMGAFGVALEIKKRLALNIMPEKRFDLKTLVDRTVKYGKSFICKGGKERCDIGCEIAVIEIDGKKYPFGGACNRYYNLRHKLTYDVGKLDLVSLREKLVFEQYARRDPEVDRDPVATVGINRSFLVHSLYPLYFNFFTRLGLKVVLSDQMSQDGINQCAAAFCYPGEIAHGYFSGLLKKDLDYIFLPHLKGLYVPRSIDVNMTCPLLQGEPYYLRTTFMSGKGNGSSRPKLLTPILDFTKGWETQRAVFAKMAAGMGFTAHEGRDAFDFALTQQRLMEAEMKRIGREVLAELEADPKRLGMVLFGRPYNAFVKEAHMGIPNKFASRGVVIIPYDYLPYEDMPPKEHMYWAMGQMILKAARMVHNHNQLFGTYITNFSCGPDSFVIGYFREIMGKKPSLTLELDSHTADAGLETRIEAYLDIVSLHRELYRRRSLPQQVSTFKPTRAFIENEEIIVETASGERLDIYDKRVKVILPSMGDLATVAIESVLQGKGFNAVASPPADEEILKLGRAHTSCKECLPMILTTGTMIKYAREQTEENNEILVYFMPTAMGPCRFGQYCIYLQSLVERMKLRNVAILTLSSENGYGGLSAGLELRIWWAMVIADIMNDIRNVIRAIAVDQETGMKLFQHEWRRLLDALKGGWRDLTRTMRMVAHHLGQIRLQVPLAEAKKISLVGEIFVRSDDISRQHIVEKLAQKGYVVRVAPLSEWIYYSTYLVREGMTEGVTRGVRCASRVKERVMRYFERRIKRLLAGSGLYDYELIDIERIISRTKHIINPELTGEAILTVGVSLNDTVTKTAGSIAIGPFCCMPNRISEAILSETMRSEYKTAVSPDGRYLQEVLEKVPNLPFLAIESDGNPFPQIIEARIETFCLQVDRMHRAMMESRKQ